MTCDHICVISAGLISETVRNVCNAVMNDVTSAGDGATAAEERYWNEVTDGEEPRARARLCRRDENPLEVADETAGC
jgi:hypothetical protein